MPASPSRKVVSNQTGIHDDLKARVMRYRETRFQRPPAEHSLKAFESLSDQVQKSARPLILDAGCGTGDSTRALARLYPDHLVIGIDRSFARLSREREEELPHNAILLRADLVDLYPLMADAGWRLARHYILYPNPYPKAAQLTRRWHAHPIFPALLSLSGHLELRTNWRLYAEEFAAALGVHECTGLVEQMSGVTTPLTPFERKYAASGHDLWSVSTPDGS